MFTNEWLVQGRTEGWKEGWKKGWKEGWKEGRREGREEALQETKNMLRGQFELRLRRTLTPEEMNSFTAWYDKKNGAMEMACAVIDLSADELVALMNRYGRVRTSKRV